MILTATLQAEEMRKTRFRIVEKCLLEVIKSERINITPFGSSRKEFVFIEMKITVEHQP